MGVYKDLNDYEIMYLVSENNEEAREILFDKYYPIIVNMAKKYRNQAKKYGLEMDDMIQEGYYGLCCAINCYNPDQDAKFYTYVLMSIKSKMLNALRVANSKKNFCLNNYISLYKKIDANKDSELFEFISDVKALYPDEVINNMEIELLFNKFLFSLDIYHASICELRYNGFNNNNISQLLDISLKNIANSVTRTNKKIRIFFTENKNNKYN